MVIGVSGYATSGKDTFAQYVCDMYPRMEIRKFSAKLKTIASILTGMDEHLFERQNIKDTILTGWGGMKVRDILQKLGTEAIRDGLYKDAWVNALFNDYREGDRWIITDMRFPNEYDMIRFYGGIVVRVNRPGLQPINGHESEVALNGHNFDYIVNNDGDLDSLKQKANVFVEELHKRKTPHLRGHII